MASDNMSPKGAFNGEKFLEFIRHLSTPERRILYALLTSSIDPIERMRFRDPEKLLDHNEVRILDSLLKEKAGFR
jgi:hypothetical protein